MAVKKITIGIDINSLEIIDKKAKETSRSRSNFITYALMDYIQLEKNKEEKDDLFKKRIAELEKEKELLMKSIGQTKPQPLSPKEQQPQSPVIKEEKNPKFINPMIEDIMDNFNN
jgi:predicted transcriptional regulator